MIALGTEMETPLQHVVRQPTRVRLKTSETGADEALEIESAVGPPILLTFRTVVLPELVDGVVA